MACGLCPLYGSVRRRHLEAAVFEIDSLKVIRHSQYQKDKKDVKDDAPPVASSYAFVKYTDEADAVEASKTPRHASSIAYGKVQVKELD
jgi:hypothetical protein